MNVSETYCEQCQENFVNNAEFTKHIKSEHSSQWNCNNCDFQASTRTILMNHCKKSPGHQPCTQKQRLGQTGVVECYTCKEEFRSYHDLMNHRKKAHPSKKKCRYYLKGECDFSSEECWYIHENVIKEDSSTHQSSDMECYVCKNTFTSKYDLMEHKKKNHPSNILCDKFLQGACKRSAEDCHYKHVSPTTQENTKRSEPSNLAQPLPNVWHQGFQQPPTSAAPDQGALVIALQTLSRRLEAIELQMFPKLI